MDTLWTGKKLGIAGGGNMAEAVVKGLITANLMPANHIVIHDPLPARRTVFAELGCFAAESVGQIMEADVVLLAMKPQQLRDSVRAMATGFRPGTVFISIAAGIGSGVIEQLLPAGSRVIRVMPNTPLLVGKGTSALAKGKSAGSDDMKMALALFACSGTAVEVEERLLDTVTALSGSGPAYFFLFAEALIAAGVQLGLGQEMARELTIDMLAGSAEMLTRNHQPELLRERVTSPGGTTAAALAVFAHADFSRIVSDALAAARNRSIELGREK